MDYIPCIRSVQVSFANDVFNWMYKPHQAGEVRTQRETPAYRSFWRCADCFTCVHCPVMCQPADLLSLLACVVCRRRYAAPNCCQEQVRADGNVLHILCHDLPWLQQYRTSGLPQQFAALCKWVSTPCCVTYCHYVLWLLQRHLATARCQHHQHEACQPDMPQ